MTIGGVWGQTVYINEQAWFSWQMFTAISLFLAGNIHVFFAVHRVSEIGIKEP